jgi:hypothetical protein
MVTRTDKFNEGNYRHIELNGVNLTVFHHTLVSSNNKYLRKVQREKEYFPLGNSWYLFLGNANRSDLCKAAGLKVFDVAVPQPWLDKPENLKRWKSGNWAVWSYDGRYRTFGNPVWSTEVFRKVKAGLLKKMDKRQRRSRS